MRWQIIFNRYVCNFLVFIASGSILVVSFYILLNIQTLYWFDYAVFIPLNFVCLHYLFNITHIASHNQISRFHQLNKLVGNIAATLGGLTFADFTTTHIVHHLHPADEKKDPDFPITKTHSGKTNFLVIPFKIWMHDVFFWESGLWKKRRNWLGYIADRSLQISIVAWFNVSGNISIWLWFWLFPILLVGFLNGIFLFYFPHFTTKWEQRQRNQSSSILHVGILVLIDISRIYHEFHHNNVAQNSHYYPLESYIGEKIYGSWVDVKSHFKGKYVHS